MQQIVERHHAYDLPVATWIENRETREAGVGHSIHDRPERLVSESHSRILSSNFRKLGRSSLGRLSLVELD